MVRSSNTEHALRINAAIVLLKELKSVPEAVRILCDRYKLSTRQAYRYVGLSQQQNCQVEVPEARKVFSIKLPLSLIKEIRLHAKQSKRSISDIVMEALKLFLTKR
jgi:hypothetical protein